MALSTLGLAGIAPAAASAAPAAASPLVKVTPAPKLPDGARASGAVAASTSVSAAVALRLPSQTAVDDFITAVTNPHSAAYHHYLSRGQFTDRFGPSAATVNAVEAQLRADGLKVTGVSSNRLLIEFSGTASHVESAFHTDLQRVVLSGGRVGRATTSAVRLPARIASDVQAVVGLNDLVQEQSTIQKTTTHSSQTGSRTLTSATSATTDGGPEACADASAQSATGALTDQQVAASYGVDPLYAAGDLASNETVDIYELEPFSLTDIAAFDECYFGASHTSQITVTSVDGGPGTGAGSGEAALDVEDVSALAPGAKIHVFSGPNTTDPFGGLDTWNALVQADDAAQVSSSWGICEPGLATGSPGEQQVENEIFEQAAAQGQTVFSAAGDDGSDSCAYHAATPSAPDLSVLDPASQPYVVSVGGTTISDATEPPKEAVWNNGNNGGAGGGGISASWPMPSWQDAVAVTQTTSDEACSNDPTGTADEYHLAGEATTLTAGTTCRETPDVSALADPQTGITIYYSGVWTQIGGTSSATPLWAAMLAEINGSSSCHGLTTGIGFAAPLLYDIADSSATNYANAFNDITQGNNDNLDVGTGDTYPAGKGYDMATGLGTPRVTNTNGEPGLAAQLCALASGSATIPAPTVTSLIQTSGTTSIAGGGSLTIAGEHFGTTTGKVFFGNASATVTSWSSTSVTVTIPAYVTPPGTVAGVGGSADVEVVTAGSAQQSSTPTSAAVYHYTANSAGHPVVDYVSSSSGPSAGGNTVDIVGAGFTGATSVTFGDVAATSFTVKNADNITATVPATDDVCATSSSQGICAVAVTVTTSAGTSASPTILPAYSGTLEYTVGGTLVPPSSCDCEVVPQPEEYDYAATPTITSVSPTYASELGGTTETITGTGFNLLDFKWVNVGKAGVNDNEDTTLDAVTATQLVVTLPEAATDTTEPVSSAISVLTTAGLSNVSSFDYAGTPTLTSISKHLASHDDPGTLTIKGTGLIDATSVVFQAQGSLDFLTSTSTNITDQTDNQLTVAIPSFFIFPTDVLVCSATGCTEPDPAVDTFQLAYAGRPVLTGSSPKSGPAHGGTVVTLQGALDSEVTAVYFGSTPGEVLSYTSDAPSGPLTVEAPAGTAGKTVDITIATLGGTLTSPPEPRSADTSSATFTYERSTPSAPLHVTATAGVKKATVRWQPPSNTGGSKVLGYAITGTAKGHTTVRKSVEASVRKWTFTGLGAHVAWTFTVRAVNAKGSGPGTSATVTTS